MSDVDKSLARLQRALERVRQAEEKLAAERAAFRAELEAAVSAGTSKSEIARMMGVSRQRVQKFFQ